MKEMDKDAVIRMAITCLGHVLGSDFRGTEIEVGGVQGVEGKFTVLSEEEIVEAHLPRLAGMNRSINQSFTKQTHAFDRDDVL
jgi:hypothetical protein